MLKYWRKIEEIIEIIRMFFEHLPSQRRASSTELASSKLHGFTGAMAAARRLANELHVVTLWWILGVIGNS